MKNKLFALMALALLSTLNLQLSTTHAQGTAFTYQGRLNNGANPANGSYDLQCTLFGDAVFPGQIAGPITNSAVGITNGLFTVTLDFGSNVFGGGPRWLGIGVRINGSASAFTILSPRQQLTPTPYAIYAASANTASSVSSNAVASGGIQDGTITSAKIAAGQVVKTLNGLTDNVTLSAGTNITFSPSGNTIQISSSGGAGVSGWALSGNSGTMIGNFLGTTDGQPLELRVNSQRALWLYPSAGSPSLIGGYAGNLIVNGVTGATVAGGGNSGGPNYVVDSYGTVGGGAGNTAGNNDADVNAQSFATVSGGLNNSSIGQYATVGGGSGNISSSNNATVGGGDGNLSSGNTATVGGGYGNTSSSDYGTVAGGYFNQSSGGNAAVGGGASNKAIGGDGAIGGGAENTASGFAATVPGGDNNLAQGDYSFAAGQQAKALHDGCFVWADFSDFGTYEFDSTSSNQFCIRAHGGVQLDPLTSVFCGSQTRQMLNLWSTNYGVGVQSGTLYFRSGSAAFPSSGQFAWFKYGQHNDNTDNPGFGGTELMRLDNAGNLRTLTGTIASLSDRNAKTDLEGVNAETVLAKVAALPISTWRYKTADSSQRHIGPMAQDFYAAFNVGLDDKSICTVDEDGVALVAIQGLNQKVEEKETRIQEQAGEIADLKARLEKLEQLVRHQIGGAK